MRHEDVAIFWDYENCHAAATFSGHELVSKIRSAAHAFGSVKLFKAYLELSEAAASSKCLNLWSELQLSGVSLTDCPHNGRKDVADKMIIVDMLTYAIDNPVPATIILISGDRDFAYAVSTLRLRRYRVVIISPTGVHVSLKSQASVFLDWNSDILGSDGQPSVPVIPRNRDRRVSTSFQCHHDLGSEVLRSSSNLGQSSDVDSDVDLVDYIRPHATRRSRRTSRAKEYEVNNAFPQVDIESFDKSQTPESSVSPVEDQRFTIPVQRPLSRIASAPASLVYSADFSPSPTVLGVNSSTLSVTAGSVTPVASDSLSSNLSPTNNQAPPVPYTMPSSSSLSEYTPSSLTSTIPKPQLPAVQSSISSLANSVPPALTQTSNMVIKSSPAIFSTSPHPPTSTAATNATTPVQPSNTKLVPPQFKLLVERLDFHRSRGSPRPFRTVIAVELATRDHGIYRRAGTERFGQYVALAEKAGIIELGGKEGGAWIGLCLEWYAD